MTHHHLELETLPSRPVWQVYFFFFPQNHAPLLGVQAFGDCTPTTNHTPFRNRSRRTDSLGSDVAFDTNELSSTRCSQSGRPSCTANTAGRSALQEQPFASCSFQPGKQICFLLRSIKIIDAQREWHQHKQHQPRTISAQMPSDWTTSACMTPGPNGMRDQTTWGPNNIMDRTTSWTE